MVLLLAVAAAVVAFGSQPSGEENSGKRLLQNSFAAFKKLDVDNSKTLTAEELQPYMFTAEAEDFLVQADSDRDGMFEAQELAEAPLADDNPTAGSRKRALGRSGVKPGQYIERSPDWDVISGGASDGAEYFQDIASARGLDDANSVTKSDIIAYSGGLPRGWDCKSDSECLSHLNCRPKVSYTYKAYVECNSCTFGYANSGSWWCAGFRLHIRVTEYAEKRLFTEPEGHTVCTNEEIEEDRRQSAIALAENDPTFGCAWCYRCAWPFEIWHWG